MQCYALVSDASDVLIEGAVACVCLFNFLVLRYVVTVVVCVSFMFIFMCATVECVLLLLSDVCVLVISSVHQLKYFTALLC